MGMLPTKILFRSSKTTVHNCHGLFRRWECTREIATYIKRKSFKKVFFKQAFRNDNKSSLSILTSEGSRHLGYTFVSHFPPFSLPASCSCLRNHAPLIGRSRSISYVNSGRNINNIWLWSLIEIVRVKRAWAVLSHTDVMKNEFLHALQPFKQVPCIHLIWTLCREVHFVFRPPSTGSTSTYFYGYVWGNGGATQFADN